MDATSVPVQLMARQATWVLVGSLLMVVVMRIDYRAWQQPTVINTAVGGVLAALLLLAVMKLLGAGHNVKGAVRWLGVGSIGIQPSEFAKLAVILFVARLLSQRMERINDLQSVVMPVGSVLGAMALLILYQPDLGTTVSICIVAFSMLFAAGLSLQYIGLSALVATPALYVLVWLVPYRRARVLAFLDPWADPLGSGFQIIQSLIAVGTGGLFGRGLMEGLQKLRFLPEPQTDFIYAVISEETGLLGALAVLLALLVIALARPSHRGQRPGSLRRVPGGRPDDDDGGAGPDQHQRRPGTAADQGTAVAVREFGRVVDAGQPDRPRHPAQRVAARGHRILRTWTRAPTARGHDTW